MSKLNICYSIADQDFHKTKSLGIFNLSVGLLEALSNHEDVEKISVLTNPSQRVVFPQQFDHKYERREIIGPSNNKFLRILWDQWRVYASGKKSKADWLFLPKGFMSFVRKTPIKTAAYIHDAMHDHYQRNYPTAVSKKESSYFRKSFNATIERADIIFTNSEFTAGEVQRMATSLNLPIPRIVPCGIGFNPAESHVVRKENHIVFLTGKFPHKRTQMASEFLNKWQNDFNNDWNVDLVGSLPENWERPSKSHWKHHSRLPDDEFHDLIRKARVLVFASDYEGFGMPPVEAVLLGTFPVYSSIPATLEVMENSGFPFKNDHYQSFCEAMNNSIKADASLLETWSHALLQKHDWRKVARRVISGLQATSCN